MEDENNLAPASRHYVSSCAKLLTIHFSVFCSANRFSVVGGYSLKLRLSMNENPHRQAPIGATFACFRSGCRKPQWGCVGFAPFSCQ